MSKKKTSKKAVASTPAVEIPQAVIPAVTEPTTPAVKAEKAAKPEIKIDDLKISAKITVKAHKSCVSFVNGKGNKWYLKGHTLEITNPIPELADRLEIFSKDVIEKCHLGYVTCRIKHVADTADLQSILKFFADSDGIVKAAKKEKPAKKAKKAAKVEAPVAETPAPAVEEPTALALAA